MTANVVGMSQYADLGRMTTKPYAAGGAYINRMSDYCGGCRYDPRKRLGDGRLPVHRRLLGLPGPQPGPAARQRPDGPPMQQLRPPRRPRPRWSTRSSDRGTRPAVTAARARRAAAPPGAQAPVGGSPPTGRVGRGAGRSAGTYSWPVSFWISAISSSVISRSEVRSSDRPVKSSGLPNLMVTRPGRAGAPGPDRLHLVGADHADRDDRHAGRHGQPGRAGAPAVEPAVRRAGALRVDGDQVAGLEHRDRRVERGQRRPAAGPLAPGSRPARASRPW